MKFLNSKNYVEVKDQRYRIHPTENIILRKRDPPKSFRSQCQVQNEIQIFKEIRKSSKPIKKNWWLKIVLKINNQIFNNQKSNHKPPNCPSCKLNNWLEFDKCYYCQNSEYIINKQKCQIDKDFSQTRSFLFY